MLWIKEYSRQGKIEMLKILKKKNHMTECTTVPTKEKGLP